MWKDYANNGNGCAIGFDFDGLKHRSNGGQAYSIAPMLYERAKQSAMVAKLLRCGRSLSRCLQISSDERKAYWGDVIFEVVKFGLSFKKESLSHERESGVSESRSTPQLFVVSSADPKRN